MLTADDTPTIRHAIIRRLDKESGVNICEIKFGKVQRGDWVEENGLALRAPESVIHVGILAQLGHTMVCRSRFELPDPFEIGHVHAEIDEICEQFRAARKDFFTEALPVSEERELRGTGLRGRWTRYGLRV